MGSFGNKDANLFLSIDAAGGGVPTLAARRLFTPLCGTVAVWVVRNPSFGKLTELSSYSNSGPVISSSISLITVGVILLMGLNPLERSQLLNHSKVVLACCCVLTFCNICASRTGSAINSAITSIFIL